MDLIRKNRQDEATTVESSIADPLARKLVEWVVLRSEDGSSDFSRYSAFINANPSWPNIRLLRRRACGGCGQRHSRHRCKDQNQDARPTIGITQTMLPMNISECLRVTAARWCSNGKLSG